MKLIKKCHFERDQNTHKRFKSYQNLKKEGYYLSENILQFDYVTFFIGELKRRKVKEKAN